MVFFRSEEHLENWAQYEADKKEGVITVQNLMTVFSNDFFKKRLEPDYVSNLRQYGSEFVTNLQKIENMRGFWKLG